MHCKGIVVLMGFVIVGCQDGAKPVGATGAAVTPVANATTSPALATAAPPAAAANQTSMVLSSDMSAFLAMLDGKDGSSRKALKKYGGNSTIQEDDLGMYMLTNPKVTKSEKEGDLQCYTVESSAGVMKHTTRTCWDAKGKITKLSDTSS